MLTAIRQSRASGTGSSGICAELETASAEQSGKIVLKFPHRKPTTIYRKVPALLVHSENQKHNPTIMSITKNDNGTLSIGADIQIVSSYNKETKQHTFNFLKTGCVPVIHIGNHLTLRNNLHKLVAELESTFVPLEGEVASEVASESIPESVTFEQIEVDENAPTSESEDYNMFKDYLKKFSEATGEERERFAEIASQILLGMNIQAV